MPDEILPRGHPSDPRHTNHLIVRWAAPSIDFVKLSFDGSCRGSSAYGGFILRDWLGCLHLVGSYNYGATTITVTEAHAMPDGIFNTIQKGFHQIIVEGDNLRVIGAASGSSAFPWRIQQLLMDIRYWQAVGVTLIFKHTYREANRAAD